MKPIYLRTAIFISIFTLVAVPVQAHTKDSEHNEASKLRQLKSELPAKIKEQAEQVRERVENLESTINQNPENSADAPKSTPVQQEKSKKEPVIQKNTTSESVRQKCVANEARMHTLIASLNNERQQAITQITRVSEAAQVFYTSNQLRVAHYDQLVAAVTRARTIAETTKSQLVTSSAFSCDDTALRTTMQTYQAKRTASATGVKVYRDATKALVNAIRDVNRTSSLESSPR